LKPQRTEIKHFEFGMPENKYREEYSEYRSGNKIFVLYTFIFSTFSPTEEENEILTIMIFMTVHPTIKNQNALKKQLG